MPRPPRFIPSGSLIEITNRTIQGRFLLKPSPELNRRLLGVLGRAQSAYFIEIHHFTFMSNHFHMLVTAPDAEHLSGFMSFFKGNLSKEISLLYGWKGPMWEGRFDARIVSDEEVAQIQRLDYVIGQGCKENLVGSPTDWPGAKCLRAWLSGKTLEGIWFNRTEEWAARQRRGEPDPLDFAERTTVELTPLPCWGHLSEHQVRALIASRARFIEEQTRERHRRMGTEPLGSRSILAADPEHRPPTLRSVPAPRFHTATKAAYQQLHRAMTLFIEAYYEARDRFRVGLEAQFPVGSFPSPRALVPL